MTTQLVRFFNLVMAGLVAGTMFGIWLGFDPRSLSPSAYVEHQQNTIRALNVVMPVLGAICILLTIAHAILVRSDRLALSALILAALLLVAAGLITRFGNQPINAIVMTWQASAPPSNWAKARDHWWTLHLWRTVAGMAAFCCITAASIRRGR